MVNGEEFPQSKTLNEKPRWFPQELNRYGEGDLNEYRASYSIDNLRRFAALNCCLAGGETSTSLEWPRDPELKKLVPMLQKVRDGGHIVDIAAGFGEPSVGMLLELTRRFHLTNTRYLITDLGTYCADSPDEIDMLGSMLVHNPRPIWVDRPEDFYFNWSEAKLDRSNWQDMRERILRRYGKEWDATTPQFFANARKALKNENIGLLILRHPEIGDKDQPELVPIFTRIIHNILGEAVKEDIPVLITTSNNDLSRDNIQRAVDSFFESQNPATREKWGVIAQESPHPVQKNLGHRVLDLRMWAIFPNGKI